MKKKKLLGRYSAGFWFVENPNPTCVEKGAFRVVGDKQVEVFGWEKGVFEPVPATRKPEWLVNALTENGIRIVN